MSKCFSILSECTEMSNYRLSPPCGGGVAMGRGGAAQQKSPQKGLFCWAGSWKLHCSLYPVHFSLNYCFIEPLMFSIVREAASLPPSPKARPPANANINTIPVNSVPMYCCAIPRPDRAKKIAKIQIA